jgi:hypothetical protein
MTHLLVLPTPSSELLAAGTREGAAGWQEEPVTSSALLAAVKALAVSDDAGACRLRTLRQRLMAGDIWLVTPR